MFASAVYPLLVATLTCRLPSNWKHASAMFGFVLVILICISRIMVGAHSVSEVVAGLVVGATVSTYAIVHVGPPHTELDLYLPLVMVIWLAVAPLQTPQVPTHSLVTRLSLLLSGHAKPCARREMLRHSVKK